MEINPNYRFQQVFQELFHPDVRDYPALRAGLFQLLLHQSRENDIRAGMTREEYYKKILGRAFVDGDYGAENKEAYLLFQGNEREILLEGLLTLYREGDSIEMFRRVPDGEEPAFDPMLERVYVNPAVDVFDSMQQRRRWWKSTI